MLRTTFKENCSNLIYLQQQKRCDRFRCSHRVENKILNLGCPIKKAVTPLGPIKDVDHENLYLSY